MDTKFKAGFAMLAVPLAAFLGWLIYMLVQNKGLAILFGIICGIVGYILLAMWLIGTSKGGQKQ